jgi:hypothetical protein
MKKTTGKVVSLVLALALVVTSFSGTFAFASTKSVSGTVSSTKEDSIYLANGATSTYTGLLAWINPVLDTKDHQDSIGSATIDAISHSSGSTLVQSTVADDGEATLKLKSTTNSGTEVLSVLYEATYVNSDGDDVIVKARKDFTVNVLDAGSIVMGKSYDAAGLTARDGLSIEDLSTFAQTKNSTQEVGIYTVAATSATDPEAVYSNATVTTATTGITTAGAVSLAITGGDVHFTTEPTAVAGVSGPVSLTVGKGISAAGKYPTDGSVANVTLTAKKSLLMLRMLGNIRFPQ